MSGIFRPPRIVCARRWRPSVAGSAFTRDDGPREHYLNAALCWTDGPEIGAGGGRLSNLRRGSYRSADEKYSSGMHASRFSIAPSPAEVFLMDKGWRWATTFKSKCLSGGRTARSGGTCVGHAQPPSSRRSATGRPVIGERSAMGAPRSSAVYRTGLNRRTSPPRIAPAALTGLTQTRRFVRQHTAFWNAHPDMSGTLTSEIIGDPGPVAGGSAPRPLVSDAGTRDVGISPALWRSDDDVGCKRCLRVGEIVRNIALWVCSTSRGTAG